MARTVALTLHWAIVIGGALGFTLTLVCRADSAAAPAKSAAPGRGPDAVQNGPGTTSPGSILQIPIRGVPGRIPLRSGDIVRVGASADADKLMVAAEWHQPNVLAHHGLRMDLYLNADADDQTGRASWDYQISFEPATQRLIKIRYWWRPGPDEIQRADRLHPGWRKHGAVQEALVPYPGDTVVSRIGDAFLIVLKASLFDRCPITSPLPSRLLTTAHSGHKSVWEGKLLRDADIGNFPQRFVSPGFVPAADSLAMPDPDLRPLLARDGVRLWDAGMQKVSRAHEAPPGPTGGTVHPLTIAAAQGESESRCLAVLSRRTWETVAIRLIGGAPGVSMTSSLVAEVNDVYDIPRPDRLVPTGSGPLRAGAVTSYWLQFHVPADARPGPHRFSLNLDLSGNGRAQSVVVPVHLTVFGFSLPIRPALNTAFALSWGSVRRYGTVTPRVRHWYSDWFTRRRFGMRVLNPPPSYTWDGHDLTIDWAGFDQFARQHLNRSIRPPFQPVLSQLASHDRMDRLLRFGIEAPAGDAFALFWSQYTRQLQEHLVANGWLDQATFNIWDEPYTCWDDILRVVEIARSTAPRLRPAIIISHFEPRLHGKIRHWIVGRYRRVDVHERLAHGDTVWTYNPGVYGLTDPAEMVRAYYWMLHRDGITGCLQWSINHWKTGTGFRRQNRDPSSCWIYPHPDGTAETSIRAEITREAIEDYDYLDLLRRAAAESTDGAAQALLAEAGAVLGAKDELALPAMNVPYWELTNLRDRIGHFLSGAAPGVDGRPSPTPTSLPRPRD